MVLARQESLGIAVCCFPPSVSLIRHMFENIQVLGHIQWPLVYLATPSFSAVNLNLCKDGTDILKMCICLL